MRCAAAVEPNGKSGFKHSIRHKTEVKMKTSLYPKYHYPWREGNQYRLLIDGHVFFPAMLNAIAAAQHYILLEIYLISSGTVATRFMDALAQAVSRGVHVRVLLDDFGAGGFSKADRQKLLLSGVKVAYYNPVRFSKWWRNLFRDHRKLLLVDGRQAFVGGAGLTDDFDPPKNPERRWRETMVEIRGANVTDWRQLFESNWSHWSDERLGLPHNTTKEGTMSGRVTICQWAGRTEIMRSLIKRTRSAQHRAWIATAYFVPSWKLLRALRAAARHGTDVRLLVPGPYMDHPGVRFAAHRFYSRLLRSGVRVFEYQPRFLHAKVLLCDNWVSIGSSNIDRWNLRWNLEANQEVEDQGFAEQVRASFEEDFRHSTEILYATWRQRRWKQRLREWFWGRIDRLVNSDAKDEIH